MQLKQEEFRDIISGQRKGFAALLVRICLNILGAAYSLTIRLRNRLYNKGIFKTHSVSAPVISIGNITTGGTGKTPLVVWIVRHLTKQHYSAAILTRGYKSSFGVSDEATLLAQTCPGTPVIINPNRIKGAKLAISQGANILVMDDGFQHRRLTRDLDILTIDATEPFGFGKILPAGLLRESLKEIRRADAVVITRADQCNPEKIDNIKQTIKKYNSDMPIACTIHRPKSFQTASGKKIIPEEIKGKKIFAYCGIGNPNAFLNTLNNLGVHLVGKQIFSDHYHYSKENILEIYKNSLQADAELIVTTEKDWMKNRKLLRRDEISYFAYLVVELEFIEGESIITALIDRIIRTDKNV